LYEFTFNSRQTLYQRRDAIVIIDLRSGPELDEISRLLSNQKVSELAKKIDEVNPKRETTSEKGGPDIFEI
ncbi:MAG: hypothetical protein DLM72_13640, partial [Candidatus Nitrosopolaris wilkensis]